MEDELDRILSVDADVVPSSGFARSVMDAVRRDATTPPPIAFPWMRALPLICAAVVAVILVVANGVLLAGDTARPPVPDAWMAAAAAIASALARIDVQWLAFALMATIASVALAQRLNRL